MPGSRALKGMACGLADTFISRNNDVSGYWGIGQVQRELQDCQSAAVELDLVNAKATPDGPIARALAERYGLYLAAGLLRDGFRPPGIAVAKILIEFGASSEASSLGRDPPWALFKCTVILAGASGKVHSIVRTGHSRPHDASHEQRSKRAR